MGQHRQPAGVADRLDRLPRAQALARHVRRPAPADEPPERVLDARRVARRRSGPGRSSAGRARRRRSGSSRRDLVVDRQADLAQRSTRSARTGRAAPRAATRASPRTPRRRGPSRSRGCAARRPASGMPRARALISTPGISSIGAGIARPSDELADTPASVSWSVIASVVMPAAAAARTSSTGVRTPSERSVWVWRSTTDEPAPLPAAARSPGRGVVPAHAQTSTSAAIRSIASARPVAGSMSIWAALKTTGAVADLEPRRQRVDEPRQDGLRVEPDHAPDRAGHPEVRLVGGPARQDPLVAGDDVGVRPDDGADPPVEVEPERVLLGRQLAVEVDEADRRQRLRRLVEQRVGVGERVLDRLHVRPALEVDDRELRAVERVVHAPAAAGDAVVP